MSAPLDVLVAERRRFQDFLERRLGDRDEADDLLQSALLRALQRPPPAADAEGVTRWFYRVLRNALIDRARRRETADRAAGILAAEPAATEDDQLWDAVCGCVTALADTLPPTYAEILRAVDVGATPVSEAATRFGVSPGNARVRLHRAREALRERVEAFCRTCAAHGCLDCTCRQGPDV